MKMDQELSKNILKSGTTILGIVCSDGVVMGADRQTTAGNLVMSKNTQKAVQINDYLVVSGTGNASDIEMQKKLIAAELKLKEFDNLLASNVSGDVWVKGQQSDSGQTRLSSVTGDITLAFEGEVNARAKINTGPGGWISNDMSSDEVKNVFPNQQKLMMTLGDGSGRIKIGTVTGGIKLKGKNQ